MELDAAVCYRALRTRDRRFDGRFFTGVLSTGIYCRPLCPAPTPRADRVRFFACAAAAEEAGFRPCRRCRPESAPGSPAWVGSPAVVARALRLIGEGALEDAGVPELAERLGVGERQLRRLFTSHVGVAPGAVARQRRAHLARRLLDETDLPMTEVALAAGYESLRQFNHDLRQRFGEPPSVLRARKSPGAHARKSPGAHARKSPGAHARKSPDTRGVGETEGALSLRLAYRPPFDAEALLAFLAARAIPGVECVDGGGYRRSVRLPGGAATLTLRPVTERMHVVLALRGAGIEGIQSVVARTRRLFDLDADPAPIAAQLGRSPALAKRVAARPGLRVPGAFDAFECAVRAVLGQQVTVRGATTLAGRLVERFGTPLGDAAETGITHLFPEPAALAEADLAAIGLPRARAASLRTLAHAVAKGELALDASRGLDEFVARMTALPGIGAWTAQYVAMRALGEPDAFPASDLGLRRALARGGRTPSAAALAAAAASWRPWRAYAAVHLWTEGEAT